MISIFTDSKQPVEDDVKSALAETYCLWQMIREYVLLKYPKATEEWSTSKYGWNFRMKDKKRAIIYLLPRDKFFKVAFVFGQKATNAVMESQVSNAIKAELNAARVYAEGRGIRIEINSPDIMNDIKTLIDIKLTY